MRKRLTAALLLSLATLASADVSVTTDTRWDMQQKLKSLQDQVSSLQAQVAKLQADNTKLQSEKQDLQSKLDRATQQLDSARTQPAAPIALPVKPQEMLKDYPQDKLPIYKDPSNILRVRALNDYLARTWNNRLVTITGNYAATTSATNVGIIIQLTTPDPAASSPDSPLWTASAALPSSAGDQILRLKKGDPVTLTGTLSHLAYFQQNAKTATLTLTLKNCTLSPAGGPQP